MAPAIRDAGPGDHAAIDVLLRTAFGGAAEATLVAALRAEGVVLAELVAIRDGQVSGQVTMSAAPVAGRAAAALAPLAVAEGARRQGTGAALVRAALARCAAGGCAAVLVLGDPAYYARFGFSAEAVAGVTGVPWAGSPAFQALALRPGERIAGEVRYAAAFGPMTGGQGSAP